MTWQAPWAALGLIAVALPIFIHLLGQGKARRLPFPSLQFLGAARPLPTRRTRLHDLLLLAVRIAILVAAVAALAQPLLLTARRRGAFDASLARAIIVDTSASMQRTTAAGERAVDAALRMSQPLVDSATTGIVLRTASPAHAIAGAVAWLNRQAGRGELVIVSDFQTGAVDSVELAAVTQRIGIHLMPIRSVSLPVVTRSEGANGTITAHVALLPDRTDVEWAQEPAVLGEERNDIRLLTSPEEVPAGRASRDAAATIAVRLPTDSNRDISIVYPGYAGRTALEQRATSLRSPWMASIVARIGADSTLKWAAEGDTLLLFTSAPPGSTASASLLAAVRRALSIAPPLSELDPSTIPDSTLTAWQRAPIARTTPSPGADESDGRWLWVAAIVLLAIEWLLRNRMTAKPAVEVGHDAAG